MREPMMDIGVIELRQYQLAPGRRDELIDIFDSYLVEPQEECGMRILGQFRDLDRPDWFVWLRGFQDMTSRNSALADFYFGPIWAEHRAAANATMIDSDNVLLLRPAPSLGLWWERPPPIGLVEIDVRSILPGHQDRELELIDQRLTPALRRVGASPVAVLVTEPAQNGFPALPVRENGCVVVTVFGFADAAHHHRYRKLVGPQHSETPPLRLMPTARSHLGKPRQRGGGSV
jgi:hypothetical protein